LLLQRPNFKYLWLAFSLLLVRAGQRHGHSLKIGREANVHKPPVGFLGALGGPHAGFRCKTSVRSSLDTSNIINTRRLRGAPGCVPPADKIAGRDPEIFAAGTRGDVGWAENELTQRREGDTHKVNLARRLRAEPTMSLAWIADRLRMGSWSYVSNPLRTTKSAKSEDRHLNLNMNLNAPERGLEARLSD
jgi:hypothetical protein